MIPATIMQSTYRKQSIGVTPSGPAPPDVGGARLAVGLRTRVCGAVSGGATRSSPSLPAERAARRGADFGFGGGGGNDAISSPSSPTAVPIRSRSAIAAKEGSSNGFADDERATAGGPFGAA